MVENQANMATLNLNLMIIESPSSDSFWSLKSCAYLCYQTVTNIQYLGPIYSKELVSSLNQLNKPEVLFYFACASIFKELF